MMVHNMKLNNEPFNMIKDNRKTIELRLLDDKRRGVNTGVWSYVKEGVKILVSMESKSF